MTENEILLNNRITELEKRVSEVSGINMIAEMDGFRRLLDKTLEIDQSMMEVITGHIAQMDADKSIYFAEIRDAIVEKYPDINIPDVNISLKSKTPKVVAVDDVSPFSRTGTVLPTKLGNRSRELSDYILKYIKAKNISVSFDTYVPDSINIGVHEFCGALGGASIAMNDTLIHIEAIYRSMEDEYVTEDYCDRLRNADVLDKYNLRPGYSAPESVIFLPGSNCMWRSINYDVVEKMVRDGAKIKPHPITNHVDILKLRERFPGAVLTAKTSGATLIKSSKVAAIAHTSELWFYAVALGIDIVDITNVDGNVSPGCYHPYIEIISRTPAEDRKYILNRMFSSPRSGLIFDMENIDSKIDSAIELLEEIYGGSLLRTN